MNSFHLTFWKREDLKRQAIEVLQMLHNRNFAVSREVKSIENFFEDHRILFLRAGMVLLEAGESTEALKAFYTQTFKAIYEELGFMTLEQTKAIKRSAVVGRILYDEVLKIPSIPKVLDPIFPIFHDRKLHPYQLLRLKLHTLCTTTSYALMLKRTGLEIFVLSCSDCYRNHPRFDADFE